MGRNTRDERQRIEDEVQKEEEEDPEEEEDRREVDGDEDTVPPVGAVNRGGDLAQSLREQIAVFDANIPTISDTKIKELLERQKSDLEEMLRLAQDKDL